MNADPADATDERGVRGTIAELADALLALVRTRVELATIEFAEERERTKVRIVLLTVGAIALTVAWLSTCALLVGAFWDTRREAAIGGVLLFHLAVGVVALLRARYWGRSGGPPFAGTLAALERDREWLAKRLGGGK